MSTIEDLLLAREAIASVAASHEGDCRCRVCRAAAGDEASLHEVLHAVSDLAAADESSKELGL